MIPGRRSKIIGIFGIVLHFQHFVVEIQIGIAGKISRDKDLKINRWHHVAATYDGYLLKLYLDGNKCPKDNKQSGFITNYTTNLGIGGRVMPTSSVSLKEVFQGELAEVRIWEVARTEEQIRANMNKTIAPETNDLVWSSDDYFAKKIND